MEIRTSFLILLSLVSMQVKTENKAMTVVCKNEKTETGNIIDLSGTWQFLYGKFLTASQMDKIPSSEKCYIDVPSHWTDVVINGQTLPTFGIATYYLRVVPGRNRKLKNRYWSIYIGSVAYAYELWINDRLLRQVGRVDGGKKGFKPMYLPEFTTFKSQSDTISVVLHVANFFYPHCSGVSRACYFGNSDDMNLFSLKESIRAIFMMCILFIAFIIQLFFCYTNKQDRSHKYIALICLIFFVKLCLDSNMTIFVFFKNANFCFFYRLWMMSLLCIPVLFAHTKNRYPAEINNSLTMVVNVIYFILFIFIAFSPLPVVFSYIKIILYISMACLLYLTFAFFLTIKNKRLHSIANTISFLIMVTSLFNDLIFGISQISFWFLSQFGICIYVLTQSALEFLDYTKSHNRLLKLSGELKIINESLSSIVEEKTTDLKKANEELHSINKKQTILLSVLSTDLSYIFVKLKEESKSRVKDIGLSSDTRLILTKIQAASQKGSRVVDNMLGWIRFQTPYRPEKQIVTDLSVLVAHIVNLFSDQLESKNIKLKANIDNCLQFRCDKSHLNIIIRNLISNAIKFSHPGGCIEAYSYKESSHVIIVVQDYGIGIPADKVSLVFCSDKSKRRSGTSGEKGSGIGLLIVNELVKINNGTINCTSVFGWGTTFFVCFPIENNVS
jgi:signal transduction histidine kinase